jgi:hypothetical protein
VAGELWEGAKNDPTETLVRHAHNGDSLRMRQWIAIGAAALALACRETPRVALNTTVLAPAAGGEAFEPTLALDPANPDRILVGAMYGVPFGRGATGIWVWQSNDGGRTWTDGRLDPPRWSGGAEPTSAADVIAQFGTDGSPLVATMAGADPDPGGTFVSHLSPSIAPPPAITVYRNTKDSATRLTTLHDKPWLVVDHADGSPYRGSVYLSNGALVMDPGPAGIGKGWNGPLRSRLMLSYSRDSARTFTTPTLVDDSAFGGNLAIGSKGALGISYVRIKTKDGGADSVFFRQSTDGGVTLGRKETVAAMTGDTLLELAVLAARPNGDFLDCWSQGDRTQERTNQVRCALRTADGRWTAVRGLDSAIGPDVVPSWPTVAGTARGWYLLLYLTGKTRTDVALFRSVDGHAFAKIATLATAEGLGADRFCVAGATPCRRTRTDGFSIGDYVTLDARAGRLAAAYVFPRGTSADSAAILVTTLAEPNP